MRIYLHGMIIQHVPILVFKRLLIINFLMSQNSFITDGALSNFTAFDKVIKSYRVVDTNDVLYIVNTHNLR